MKKVRRLLLVAMVLALAVCVQADVVTYESITVAASSIGFTSTTITPLGLPQKERCVGRLETGEIRYRVDGTDPTTTEGILVEPLEVIEITRHEFLFKFRAIRTTATSGTLKFQCFDQ